MATEYRVFFLTHGQMPPSGTTSYALSGNGGIIWEGEEDTFPTSVQLGTQLLDDTEPDTTYNHRLATQAEINEYNKL
jgi:predicted Rdx family selenoprotein